MLPPLRILRDVIVYRLRKREMANLAASASIMVAIALPWKETAVRLAFGVVLNLLVYLTNDLYDAEADQACRHRDSEKAAYLREHRSQAIATLIALFGVLLGVGLWFSTGLVITAVVASGLCWAYSARLKRVAFVDIATIGACGIAGSMLAFPLDQAVGWLLAVQLGLFAATFQTVQIVRDHDDDAAYGCRTTAVHLGKAKTILVQRGMLLLAAAYAILTLHTWIGTAMLAFTCLPFPPTRATDHWNRIRGALGMAWLAIIALLTWTGRTQGLLLSVDTAARVVRWW